FLLQGNSLDDGDLSSFATVGGPLHGAEVPDEEIGIGAIALVDDKDIGDLQQTCLHRLDVVTRLGCEHHQDGIGETGDLDLVLPYSYRLDQDVIKARGTQQVSDLDDPRMKAAEGAAAG